MASNYHEARTGKVSRGTGAKRVPYRDKVKAHIGRERTYTKLNQEGTEEKKKIIRTKGGHSKVKLKLVKFVNLALPDGKVVRAEIESVIQGNTPNDTRAGYITKGTIVQVKGHGKAIITSRPNQHGILNAKLVQ